MSSIDLTAVKKEIVTLAATSIPVHPEEATQDGNALLTSAQDRLQKYTGQLANKEGFPSIYSVWP
jgi:hypothetical protein